jgi:hypothetical protein
MKLPYFSKKQLVDFSGEHLYYEIWMLYGVTQLLLEGVKNPYIFNTCLESFVIHASNILDFFYKPPLQPDDAKAVHFMDKEQVEAWKALLPSYAHHFKRFNRKRNKEVMHLSYKRLEVKPQEKSWGVENITGHIKELVNQFLRLANPAYIHPKMYELQSRQILKESGPAVC